MSLDVEQILGPDGSLARRLPHYESRPQQIEMAHAVAAAIASREHLICEAGTGVGKSYGYLVPAILAATNDDDEKRPRRIVVSTHTISLQQQLLEKDLPLLNAVIPREFTVSLMKGRHNYLSLRRLATALERAPQLFSEQYEFKQLRDIKAWCDQTGDGSLSDLPFEAYGSVWDEVASDSGNCLGKK